MAFYCFLQAETGSLGNICVKGPACACYGNNGLYEARFVPKFVTPEQICSVQSCPWVTEHPQLCFLRRQLAEQQLVFEGLEDESISTVGYKN